MLLRPLLPFLLRHSVPVAKPCSETTCEGATAPRACASSLPQRLVLFNTSSLFFACLAFAAAETVF